MNKEIDEVKEFVKNTVSYVLSQAKSPEEAAQQLKKDLEHIEACEETELTG